MKAWKFSSSRLGISSTILFFIFLIGLVYVSEFQWATHIKIFFGGQDYAVRLFMTRAHNAMEALASNEQREPDASYALSDSYAQALESVSDSLAHIDPQDKRALHLSTLHRLAGDQQVLRAIRQVPPEEPTDAIDSARYKNIEIQESIVTALEDASSGEQALHALSCPECNIVLISLTTLRKDRIGLYGYKKGTTPNIDAFFKNGLIFNNLLSPSSWTIPDAVSLFTALEPYSHGIAYREHPSVPVLYNTKIKTLTEILSANGYKTAAFTGGGDYNRHYHGLDRGFETYLDEANYNEYGVSDSVSMGARVLSYVPIRSFVHLPIDWVRKHAQEKFFLFVQGYDTHCPLYPREPYASRFTKGLESDVDFSYCHWTFNSDAKVIKEGVPLWNTLTVGDDRTPREVLLSENDVEYMRGLYDARVAESDAMLEGLFKEFQRQNLLKNTIFILMSEHGDTLGEHGLFMRSAAIRGTAIEEALKFPLIIKHPSVNESQTMSHVGGLVDVMPTILSLLGLHDPQTAIRDGTPLIPVSKENESQAPAFGGALFTPFVKNDYHSKPSRSEVIYDGEWKLVREILFGEVGLVKESVTTSLFNIVSDPHEMYDVYKKETTTSHRLETLLNNFSLRYFAQ